MADYDDDAGIKIAIVSEYNSEVTHNKQAKLRSTKTSGKNALGKTVLY